MLCFLDFSTGLADVLIGYSWMEAQNSFGILGFLSLQIAVTIIEATVFKLFNWGTWRNVLIDSTLINLITTIVGFVAALFHSNDDPVTFLFVAFVTSVLIEGYWLHKRENTMPKSHRWIMILIANILSYALLITIFKMDETQFNKEQFENYHRYERTNDIPESDSLGAEIH